MPDLLSVLGQSSNSLSAYRAAATTSANNIQNMNTPGYSRQIVEIEANPAQFVKEGAYIGRGSVLGSITQARDKFLERQIPSALGSRARFSAEAEILTAVSVLNPDNEAGMSKALASFYSSLRELSQRPSDLGLRQGVMAEGRNLALVFNRTGTTLAEAREGLDVSLEGKVDEANRISIQIADLNRRVNTARSRGAEPNDLLDERQRSMDRLAELTGATQVEMGDGSISMVLAGGAALVSGFEHATLGLEPDSANAGHLALEITRAGSSTSERLPVTYGGELRGIVDARDADIGAALSDLDQLAFDLAQTVNSTHASGFDLNGNPGGSFFDVGAAAPGASQNLTINAAIESDVQLIAAATDAGTLPGDGRNLLALMETEGTPLSGGATVTEKFASIVADFGALAQAAEAMAEQDQAIVDNLQNMRESVSGVSIDEELVNLTQAQRAFEAIGRVIRTTDEMLETVIGLR